MTQLIIGSEEWGVLPDLKIPAIKMKIDSGATTSSIDAFNIRIKTVNNVEYVHFYVYPIQDNRQIKVPCRAPLVGRKLIRSSNGISEKRVVISTTIKLGEMTWPIEVSLTNRDTMGYRMLLGKEAMKHLLVDPAASFLMGNLSQEQLNSMYEGLDKPRSSLNIGLLASNPHLYSNKRLLEAAKSRGHDIRFVNVKACHINIKSSGSFVFYGKGENLNDLDAILPRLRPSMTFYGCALLRQFKSAGIFCLNDGENIENSRDKLKCLQILAGKNLDMPNTSFASSVHDTKELIRKVGGAPLIIKLLEGTQGIGVMLLDSNKTAESVIRAFKSVRANILVQEFIEESKGRDIRAFVVGNRVVASMERIAAEGEFRSNIHLGGVARPIKLSKKENKIAVSAAKILGLHIAGVDMMRSKNGIKIIEVNSSPGLEGIEAVTKLDIAGMIIEYIERKIFGS